MELDPNGIDLARVGGVRARNWTDQGDVGTEPPNVVLTVCAAITWNCFHKKCRCRWQDRDREP